MGTSTAGADGTGAILLVQVVVAGGTVGSSISYCGTLRDNFLTYRSYTRSGNKVDSGDSGLKAVQISPLLDVETHTLVGVDALKLKVLWLGIK